MSSAESIAPCSAPITGRILCVDDDPVSQRILTAILARPGWSVECVSDGQEAIDRFGSEPWGFDLLVTDHVMPVIDGVELLRRLREMGFCGDVIVVSAGVAADASAHYRDLGARVVLMKPVDASRLRAAVTASLIACRLPAAEMHPA